MRHLVPKLILHAICLNIVSDALAASQSLSEIAGGLTTGATLLSHVMLAACLVAGLALVFTSLTQFKIHWEQPKLVPLANPIVYLALGIVLLCIPFLDQIFGYEATGSPYKEPAKKSAIIQKAPVGRH